MSPNWPKWLDSKNSQCEFCKYNDKNNKNKCAKFQNRKPENVLSAKSRCEFLDIN